MARCKKGDRLAQKKVYELHSGKMLAVCRRYMSSLEEAEEMLSNGFIKVFTRIEQYTGEGNFEGWIRRIMVNECLTALRKKSYLHVVLDESMDWGQQQEDHADNMDIDHLMSMMDQLPTNYRIVLNLYALEGYSHREISEKLNISETSSRAQLHRARIQFKQMLASASANLENYTDKALSNYETGRNR